jgi:hypothetical protein
VCLSFGAAPRPPPSLPATHRYAHSGKVTVRVTASDEVGNVRTVKRRITIRK